MKLVSGFVSNVKISNEVVEKAENPYKEQLACSNVRDALRVSFNNIDKPFGAKKKKKKGYTISDIRNLLGSPESEFRTLRGITQSFVIFDENLYKEPTITLEDIFMSLDEKEQITEKSKFGLSPNITTHHYDEINRLAGLLQTTSSHVVPPFELKVGDKISVQNGESLQCSRIDIDKKLVIGNPLISDYSLRPEGNPNLEAGKETVTSTRMSPNDPNYNRPWGNPVEITVEEVNSTPSSALLNLATGTTFTPGAAKCQEIDSTVDISTLALTLKHWGINLTVGDVFALNSNSITKEGKHANGAPAKVTFNKHGQVTSIVW